MIEKNINRYINNHKDSILKIFDILICIAIAILSIKKGGFYTSDCININIFVGMLGIIYIIINFYTDNIDINKNNKKNIFFLALIMLPITYILPIIFNKTMYFDDSFFEMIRYLSFTILFFVVYLSKNKEYYLNTINVIAAIQIVFGIDGIAGRYLSKYLSLLNSGYQTIDQNRMSGTIQYANTLAIIIAISYLLILDKLNTISIKKYKKENEKKYVKKQEKKWDTAKHKKIIDLLKKLGIYTLLFLELTSIILTGSRFALFFLCIFVIIYSFKDKGNILKCICLNCAILCYSLIISNIIQKYILTKYVYYVFVIAILVFCLIYFICYFVINKFLKTILPKFKIKYTDKITDTSKSKRNIIFLIVILVIYLVCALNLDKALIIDSNKNFEINRLAINVKKNKVNNFEIKVSELEADSRYSIELIGQDGKYKNNIITTFYYYNTTDGDFKFSFIPEENTKKIKIYIKCEKGKLKIDNCKLNDKKIIMNYLLLPSDYIYRLEDAITGTSSMADRIEYSKDAIKLIKRSPIVGLGGEGFKNNYKSVQNVKYVSSEVHNSFLQIFVESGIIGEISIFIIVIYAFKSKYSTKKLACVLLIIHSVVDLNFSYMIIIYIFSILLANVILKD